MAEDKQAWQFLIPIAQLRIDDRDPINGRWRVADVEFLSREAASSRIPQPAGDSAAAKLRTKFLQRACSFARVTRHGERADAAREAFRDVSEAINLLAVTRAFWVNRASNTGFAILGYPLVKERSAWIMEEGGLRNFDTASREGGLAPFSLDAEWHQYISHSQVRIIELFGALDDEGLDPSWRAQIRRAGSLIGRSLMTVERADAFLWNVFALETLLTRPGERNGQKLADRIEGLLGLYLPSARPSYRAELVDLFQIRCDAVHDADYGKLKTEDVLLSDLYTVNTLRNIVVNRTRFPSKDSLIELLDSWRNKNKWPEDMNIGWSGDFNFSDRERVLPLW